MGYKAKKMIRLLLLVSILIFSSVAAARDIPSSERAKFDRIWEAYAEYVQSGEVEKSLAEAHRGYELGEKILPASDSTLADITFQYGNALLQTGEVEQSRKIMELALSRHERVFGKSSVELAPVLEALATASAVKGANQSAKVQFRHYKRAVKLVRKEYGKKSIEFADISFRAGKFALLRALPMEGKSYLQDAYGVYRAELGEQSTRTGECALYLGQFALARRNHTQAISFLKIAYDAFDSAGEKFESLSNTAMEKLQEAYLYAGRYDEFVGAYGQKLEDRGTNFDYLPVVRAAPVYPAAALSRRQSGYVELEFNVNENGVPTNVEVTRSNPDGVFDKAAISAVRKFRCLPRIRDGKAVPVKGVKTKVLFELG